MSCSYEEISAIVRGFLRLEEASPLAIIPLFEGGSRRSFYRIRYGDGASVIFMRYENDRRENNYYAALAGFLRKIGVSAPRIFHHDAEKNFLLMEDLGERDLWHYRQAPWEKRRGYYFQTLNMISKLHGFRLEDLSLAGVAMMDPFDSELYRWEREYFLVNFVQGVCHIEISPSEAEALEKELALLARVLAEAAPGLIHRDLQSRNIMICDDKPVLIDFQGMRCGNRFYDLGALLYDPYVSFTAEERQELLDYYYGLSGAGCERRTFQEMFRQASVQRLMQALGAYGFLGLKAGKREFLAYIPAGLHNLLEAAGAKPDLYLLRNLTLRCRESLERKRSDLP